MIAGVISGVKAALLGGDPSDHMDLGRAAFLKSFYALAVSGLILLCAVFLNAGGVAPVAVIALILFLLTAPTVIYLICHLISRPELFRGWVIVRNWAMLGLSVLVLIPAGLGAAKILPVQIITTVLTLIYVSTLLIDIRLAQTLAKMKWTPAIFIACAISVSAMLVLLAVFASAAGY